MKTLWRSWRELTKDLRKNVTTGAIGPGELLLILVIAVMLFGGSLVVSVRKKTEDGLRHFRDGLWRRESM